MTTDIDYLLERHERLKARRRQWDSIYQLISLFVFLRKPNISTDSPDSAPFMIGKVFDATAPNAAVTMAASIIGQIWPNAYETFEFVPQASMENDLFEDHIEFFQHVNQTLPALLSVPEAGLVNALFESVMEGVGYGTYGIYPMRTGNPAAPYRFQSLNVKTMLIDENEAGMVNTIHLEDWLTTRQIVERYGYQNVHDAVRQCFLSRKLDERFRVIHIVEPRQSPDVLSLGVSGMPFASIHIDVDHRHIMRRSGFREMPVIIGRFWKNVGEVYGRSPAMEALPDIRALNVLVELYERTGEFALNPPKLIATEDILGGGGNIPWFPGANIPVHASGRLGGDRKPIEPIVTVTNPGWAQERIVDLRNQIQNYFMLDKLLDLNNRTRQTLGEANIRNQLRTYVTGPLIGRLLTEFFAPLLDRVFNMALEDGYLGVVPGSDQHTLMLNSGIEPLTIPESFITARMGGLKGYRINFISPAARVMQSEELAGLERLTQYIQATAPLVPEVMDNINWDEAVKAVQRLSGASLTLLRSREEVQQIRESRSSQQMALQDLQQAQVGAEAFKNAAKGVNTLEQTPTV